jgi:hypothetical protein
MYDHDQSRQPVLTSHELQARPVGPQRGPRKRFDVERPRQNNNDRPRNERPHRDRPPREPRAPRPKQFCHDDLLQLYKGKTVVINLPDSTVTAKLIDLDRYALLIEREDGSRHLVYKSAMTGISLGKVEQG